MSGPAPPPPPPPPRAPPYPVVEVDSHGWIRDVEFGQPPRIVRGRPPRCPRTIDAGAAPRGDQGDFFFREYTSGTEDFLTEGGTYNTRRRPQRAGPVWKGRSGDPPRSRPRRVVPPPSFLRLPWVCWGYAMRFPPRG